VPVVRLGGGVDGCEEDKNGHISGNEQDENDAQQLGLRRRLHQPREHRAHVRV